MMTGHLEEDKGHLTLLKGFTILLVSHVYLLSFFTKSNSLGDFMLITFLSG